MYRFLCRLGRPVIMLAFCLRLPCVSEAAPPPSSDVFVPIADSSSFAGTLSGGVINNAGDVVFTARLPTGESALLLWDGRTIGLLATAATGESFAFPDLNDKGEVSAAVFQPGGGLAFVKVRRGELEERVDESGDFDFLICCPFLNNRGDMALFGVLTDGTEGIFTVNRGRLETIADNNGPYTFFAPVGGINNRGQVAFIGDPDDTERANVVLGDGRRLLVVADASGPYAFFTDPAVNDPGQVAFFAYTDGFLSQRIVFWNRRSLREIASSEGPFEFFFGRLLLNNAGVLVFNARLGTGGVGTFTGPDPVADKVLAPGDSFADSVIVNATATGLNDAGRVVLSVELADGRHGFWLTTLSHRRN